MPNQELKEQRFGIVHQSRCNFYGTEKISYETADHIKRAANSKAARLDDAEVFAVDEGQTATFEDYWPEEIISEVDQLWEELDQPFKGRQKKFVAYHRRIQ